jgi:hypothetical protein
MSEPTKTSWRIAGEEFGSCNCAWGCPCQFNALPTHGRCEAFLGCLVSDGYFGNTRLDGIRFARLYWWPERSMRAMACGARSSMNRPPRSSVRR